MTRLPFKALQVSDLYFYLPIPLVLSSIAISIFKSIHLIIFYVSYCDLVGPPVTASVTCTFDDIDLCGWRDVNYAGRYWQRSQWFSNTLGGIHVLSTIYTNGQFKY